MSSPDVSTRNMHLLFNKLYYRKLSMGSFATGAKKGNNTSDPFSESANAINRALCNMQFSHCRDFRALTPDNATAAPLPDPTAAYFTAHMKTVYPGMMIGIGLPHGSGACNEDVGCGFSFDYVTGQPYIPGSTIKGMLRHAFSAYPSAIASLLNANNAYGAEEWTQEDVHKLESAIFDNTDIFLDAVLFDGDPKGYVIATETLAPHGDDPIKSPTVLSLLKIRPDVFFEFRFILKDTVLSETHTLTKETKAALFSDLLETFGIGAKTNVGYGMLVRDDNHKPATHPVTAPAASPAARPATRPATNNNSTSHEVTSRVCPHCQATNFKYFQDTKNIHNNWIENTCYKCKGRLE